MPFGKMRIAQLHHQLPGFGYFGKRLKFARCEGAVFGFCLLLKVVERNQHQIARQPKDIFAITFGVLR